jgi:hypothetical protein
MIHSRAEEVIRPVFPRRREHHFRFWGREAVGLTQQDKGIEAVHPGGGPHLRLDRHVDEHAEARFELAV